ncbi:MAG: replicative DNA helicase, partial [Planctomycetales bacterium]|nr:replicative DNA helicase [Planctomycetales bacterium]
MVSIRPNKSHSQARRFNKQDKRDTPIFDRQPPYSKEAEMAVLGSILQRPEVCDEVAMILRPTDFYVTAHQLLFEQMMNMHDAGKKIEITLLVDNLKRSGTLEQIGGLEFLAEVGGCVATAAHAEYYAQIVRQDATCRALIGASTEILRSAYESNEDAAKLVSQAEQKIFEISERGDSATVSDIKDVLHEAMDRIDSRMKGENLQGGVQSGFKELDGMMGGLHPSELLILAARPSMGKTAFAMNIAEHVCMVDKQPVLFISLEMAAIELVDRMLCSVAEVNSSRLRNGTISKDDRKRLVEKAAILSEAPLFIDDSPSRTVSEIAAAARRIKRREGKIGLIVIDYLQLIEPDNASDP